MSAYWDTSALLAALIAGHRPVGFTRPHTLAEAFSILTGRGLPTPAGRQRIHPEDAADLLGGSAVAGLALVELDAAETRQALREASAQGVRGRAGA